MSTQKPTQTVLFLAITSIAFLFACSENPSEVSDAYNPEISLEKALSTISQENIQASLNYLAADEREGRRTGTKGHEEAAQYVADQFKAMGLEPGGNDGWYQQVPLITRLIDTENSSVTLHADTGDIDLKWKNDVIIYADKVRDENSVRAEVVFVGFGVHAPELGYSDYENIDVEGKIVAMFDGAPSTFPSTERAYFSSGRTKVNELMKRGAVGVIDLLSHQDEKRYTWDEYTLGTGTKPGFSWINEAGEAADYHPEYQGGATFSPKSAELLFKNSSLTFEAAQDSAEALQTVSTALGVEVTLTRKTKHERISSPNVVGILRGSDPELSNEYVVYSTHLDHLGIGEEVDGDTIYNGLFDNALGVAMTLDIARALASMPVAPKRSIIFVAVTGEENGLLGSDYFAQFPTVPKAQMVANVNIDMPLVFFPLNTVTGYGAEHSSLEKVMEEEEEGFTLVEDPYPDEVYFIRSDQYSFVRQGIPSLYFAESIGSSDPEIDGRAVIDTFTADHYHKPSDDLTRPIDWDTALRFARGAARVGNRIAMDPERPKWNEGDFFGGKFSN